MVVSCTQSVSTSMSNYPTVLGLPMVFKNWDVNGDGRISKAELLRVFTQLGIGGPAYHCAAGDASDCYKANSKFKP
eukprot:1074759-Amphidinium_carterae.1